ncbi:MAG: c-type cytochrome [Anaerolineaceae bacterium]|nr:c-type cytochrome [Anaerolineaceae bacterium]
MDKRELLARVSLALLLIVIPVSLVVYQYVLRLQLSGVRIIDIKAVVPEQGGFQPDSIQVQSGETVTLRFHAEDVTHGVAIGPVLGVDLGEIDPGHTKEVTLTFDKAGTYTFYCNTWCSPNHWRMRGVVEVRDVANAIPVAQRDPVIETLTTQGIDIDDTVHSGGQSKISSEINGFQPSAQRGAVVISQLSIPRELTDIGWQQRHSPQQATALLVVDNPNASTSDLADAVAYLWAGNVNPQTLSSAASLYNKNCAACHGQTGSADGPIAGQTAVKPIAFADLAYMWMRRDDVLYAKIRRGGMGTDMPNFGTLFSPEETWALVDYLRSLSVTTSQP